MVICRKIVVMMMVSVLVVMVMSMSSDLDRRKQMIRRRKQLAQKLQAHGEGGSTECVTHFSKC